MMIPPSGAPGPWYRARRCIILSLLLAFWNERNFVESHFIFAKLDKTSGGEDEVQVFFSEPVAMAGPSINFLGGRVKEVKVIDLFSPRTLDPELETVALTNSGQGYLSGNLPAPAPHHPQPNPRFVTGFLDYGNFQEPGMTEAVDLQYTFSAQTSSTFPYNDWKEFYHHLEDIRAYDDFFFGKSPFAIALRNYGPPYEVVVRGVSEDTTISVCLYEGNGSNRKVGCVEGNTKGKNHLYIDSISESEILNPCQTYFALANTTGTDEATSKPKSLWSSTSVTWNGPCARGNDKRSSKIGNDGRSPGIGLGFASGILVCMAIIVIKNTLYKEYPTVTDRSKFARVPQEEGDSTETTVNVELT